MSPVTDGPIRQRTIVVHDRMEPPLVAGDYELRASQAIGGSPSLGTVPDDLRYLRVTGPRYRVPATEILSTFPPANADGPFVTRLAQVALRRRTLPWERADGPQRPWLALVLLTDGEGTYLPSVSVASAVTTGVRLTGPNPDGPTCAAIEVTGRVVREVFPSRQDLPYTCHVRQVPLDDTELAQGDEDGWVAVVLGTRLPRPGMRYRACLISLEGQWSELPDNPPVEEQITKTKVYENVSFSTIQLARQPRIDGVALAVGTIHGSTDQQFGGLVPKRPEEELDRERVEHDVPPGSPGHTAADAWGQPPTGVAAGTVGTGAEGAVTGGIAARGAAPAGFRSVGVGSVILDADLQIIDPGARLLRFPVLASWEFRCEGDKDFAALVQGLDVGLLGTVKGDHRAPAARVPEVSDTGHLALEGTERDGEAVRTWYRGPLVPRAVSRRAPLAVHVADQLRRLAEDGRVEVGEAAAFELGRLLAVSAPSTVAALREWRRQGFTRRRKTRVGAGSILGEVLEDWDLVLAGAAGEALTRQLLTTVGAPEVAENVLPAQSLVDPLPKLDLLADPARTVATGLAVSVRDVRASFAGVAMPAITEDQFGPVSEAHFDALRANPALLEPVTGELSTTVSALTRLVEGGAPAVPRGRAAEEAPAPAGDSVEDLFPEARPHEAPAEPERRSRATRRRRGRR
jgi:hypothetical protein